MQHVRSVQSRLPPNMSVKQVAGNHRKPCSECGKSDWFDGEWYIYDHVQPWGSDKYCLNCADMQFNGQDSEDSDGEEGNFCLDCSKEFDEDELDENELCDGCGKERLATEAEGSNDVAEKAVNIRDSNRGADEPAPRRQRLA